MPVTTLDPITALIVIDLQKGVLTMPIEPSPAVVVEKAVALLEAFRRHGLPVVLVNVDAGAPGRADTPSAATAGRPADWTELAPELDARPSDHRITKKTWGAFHQTGLNELLRGLGVTQVVIVGIATSAGVESTARQAHEHGFNVTLATDAMSDRSPEAHANSVERIFPRLGETGSTTEVLSVLEATR